MRLDTAAFCSAPSNTDSTLSLFHANTDQAGRQNADHRRRTTGANGNQECGVKRVFHTDGRRTEWRVVNRPWNRKTSAVSTNASRKQKCNRRTIQCTHNVTASLWSEKGFNDARYAVALVRRRYAESLGKHVWNICILPHVATRQSGNAALCAHLASMSLIRTYLSR